MGCSAKYWWRRGEIPGAVERQTPANGCFQATVGTTVISPSIRKHLGTPVRRLPSAQASRNKSIPHAASLLRHASSRGGRGSAHHSDPVRPSRSQRDHHLPPSFTTSSPRDCEPSGLTEAERPADTGGIDEPATPRGGRSHPRCGRRLHRTKPPMDPLEAHQSAAGHCAVSYRRTRRPSRSVHPLRASRPHLLQQLPEPPLPEVSDRGPATLDRRTSKRTPPDALRPCGLHTSWSTGALNPTEQKGHLWTAPPHQCRNTSCSASRTATP